MQQQPQPQKTSKNDGSPQVFNDLLKSLGAVLSKLYNDHSSSIILFVFIILFCIFILFRTVNISYLYSTFVTSLFIFLSIGLYIKEKSSLTSIFSFSLGIFTAFTVTWNGSTFSIFFVSFIVLVIGIFLIAAIKATATKEEISVRAANFYLKDFETNKIDLNEVDNIVSQQKGSLLLEKKQEAILFFAYHKVPKNRMIRLIEDLNKIYTITKIDPELLLILLKNIHCLSGTEEEFLLNMKKLEECVFKGKIVPKDLVIILNDTLYIAIENDINFIPFADTILTYSSRGYSQTSIIEQLFKKFRRNTP